MRDLIPDAIPSPSTPPPSTALETAPKLNAPQIDTAHSLADILAATEGATTSREGQWDRRSERQISLGPGGQELYLDAPLITGGQDAYAGEAAWIGKDPVSQVRVNQAV